MLHLKNTHWGRVIFNIWIIGFTALVCWAIIQIQHSRVQSCKNSYEAFNKVFKPFLHSTPTPREKRFHETVRDLENQCGKQVHLWSY